MTSLQERLQRGSQALLPGLHDELTLTHIVTRLSWKDFYRLSCVSHAWLHSIRTRQVYDARVASNATKTMVVSSFVLDDPRRFIHCLSPGRKDPFQIKGSRFQRLRTCPKLPPNPYVGGQSVFSDGYIYHVGAVRDSMYFEQDCSNKVFVFDMASGRNEWKECASMIEQRHKFGCVAMHGKLYVFGGLSKYMRRFNYSSLIFCESEVYDSKENRWSPLEPMRTLRYGHNVHIVGDELFVHGGRCFVDQFAEFADAIRRMLNIGDHSSDDQDDGADDVNCADKGQSSSDEEDDPKEEDDFYNQIVEWCVEPTRCLEVYHPATDTWRRVDPFGRSAGKDIPLSSLGRRSSWDCLFVVEGKLYAIESSHIYVYTGGNSWKHLHSFSFPVFFARPDCGIGHIITVVFIDGELTVKADWWKNHSIYPGVVDFESTGFRGENEKIIWKVTRYRNHGHHPQQSSKLVIQL